ncbi:MAG TPA: FecR domain-containing protein [Kofleriaceae bacterium]|jgi:ferric-dicitrate binding protein FerR (iron transport regulator)/tetratricopeptide (TPR) repeat protein|nr:FecR domain-containing protein [Kofleriaceae bacterium]
MTTTCDQLADQLSDLADGDRAAIARHADHLAGCDACRDARHDAEQLAAAIADAGGDHASPVDLLARVLAAVDREAATAADATATDAAAYRAPRSGTQAAPRPEAQAAPHAAGPAPSSSPSGSRRARRWIALGATAAIAAGATGLVVHAIAAEHGDPGEHGDHGTPLAGSPQPVGRLTRIERAAPGTAGVSIRIVTGRLVTASAPTDDAGDAGDAGWRPLGPGEAIAAGAELRTDDRTRAELTLDDHSRLVLDHGTQLAFGAADPRQLRLTAGRLAADVVHVDGHTTVIATPAGRVDVVGTRLSVTATDAMTAVQVTRGAVVLTDLRGAHDDVRAGEEGVIDHGALTVSAAPGLVRDAAWSELGEPAAQAKAKAAPGSAKAGSDEIASGLGALRAYKPGEARDRDWNLALARHDVVVRVVGPIARTEITETFRNDSAATLEGVYQFPLPPDAQIDSLALDSPGAPDGFIAGAFVDKERGAKIWRGVIDKATPKLAAHPSQEIIWVEGRWRDPALLDWKRGGRFELRVYPIPAHGARTIKLAYTQVVTPRGAWRQYSYPLPHSHDGSTVADQFSFDVELRGAVPHLVRTAGYDLTPDPARAEVQALTLRQSGFVPRGDLVVDYRATDGDAELRAWSFAGGAAAAPDDKLAAKRNVGIDPKVVDAQRQLAGDLRPTAVLALHPSLPRWRDGAPRDYLIVVDDSQSMVGERFARAAALTGALVDQMDRRDRFDVAVCDSECRAMTPGAAAAAAGPAGLHTPSAQAAAAAQAWLAAQPPAGASDVVGALRAAAAQLGHADGREPWILYIGDGFASTGFRRASDVEQAIAAAGAGAPRIATIGIGSDADTAVLEAAARGGGGSYLAWVPGQRVATTAAAVLESTLGAALRDATVELPTGLTDAAPGQLPTVRAGEELLIAARMTDAVSGDVILRGRVAGQPFEQRYPLRLAVSSAPGNAFVPRLWARLAIDQLERTGTAADRARIVALSQGFGVMSRETSLLVLESQAMFDAFGVDRNRPAQTWTGEDSLDEVAAAGAIAIADHNAGPAADAPAKSGKASIAADADSIGAGAGSASGATSSATKDANKGAAGDDARPPAAPAVLAQATPATHAAADKKAPAAVAPARRPRLGLVGAASDHADRAAWGPGADWIQLRRIWTRVPSVTPYDTVNPAITKAIGDAEAALAASPDSREKHRALVQALSYAGELDRAREVAQRWLDRDQLDPQALGYLADLLGRGGQRELALRTLAGLVDLDPDRVALHERMARSYEQAGRLTQACSHRIALAALQPAIPAAPAAALRCLRSLGRDADATLILRALPDDAGRAAVEKAALVAPIAASIAASITGDLTVRAHWDAPADLDLTLITPEGARISWMGGRPDVTAADVTSTDHEALAIKTLRRGNYLVEISRTAATPAAAQGAQIAQAAAPAAAPAAVHGTLDITALGARRSIPFELTGARAVVGRVSVRLEESFEELDGMPVQLYNGPDRRIITDPGPNRDRPLPRAPRTVQ